MKAITFENLEQLNGWMDENIDDLDFDADNFQAFFHQDDKITVVFVRKEQEVKQVKTTTRAAQAKRAQYYGWDVARTNDGFQIEYGQNGAVMFQSKTIRGIQQKLTKMMNEYQMALLESNKTGFLRKYKVINY